MTTSLFADDSPRCPQCGTDDPLPILHGPPSEEMAIAAKLGQIVLGGEGAADSGRLWQCQNRDCDYRF